MNRTQRKPHRTDRRGRAAAHVAAAALLAGLVALGGCRRERSEAGSHLKPFDPTDFWADHNSTRPQVEGTVARTGTPTDAYEFVRTAGTGAAAEVDQRGPAASATLSMVGGTDLDPTTGFPKGFPTTGEPLRRAIERGQQRFDIYCSVCHGKTGAADGMVVQRGFIRPPAFYPIPADAKNDPSLYQRERNLLTVPPSYFFDKITNGYGAMYSYAARVSPEDRWNIAAYVKVLQASQSVALADLSPDDRRAVEAAGTQPVEPAQERGGLGGNPAAKPGGPASLPAIPGATQPNKSESKPADTKPAPTEGKQ